MRVLITGATGFIGSRLSASLQGAGHHVLGLARSPGSAQRLHEMGVEAVPGDLTRPADLATAVRQARPDAVAHLAAEIATQRNPRLIREVNVAGTQALVEACRGIVLERFLFLSSVVVGQPAGKVLTEDARLVATTVYGQSKLDAEQLLRDEQQSYWLPVTVLRPSHVYGPGGWFAEMIHDLDRRRFLIPGDGKNMWDVVHVDDVVAAAALVFQASPAQLEGGLFHVVDDTPITFNDFVNRTCDALGRKPPGHVPVMIARMAAGRGPVDAAVRSARSSNRRLRERLGWTPKFPSCEAGIPRSVAELRSAGLGRKA